MSTEAHACIVDDSPLGNLGVFATHRLAPGEIIMSERALLERPFELLNNKGDALPAFHKYFDDIRNLGTSDKKLFVAIMRGSRYSYDNSIDTVERLEEVLAQEMHPNSWSAIQLATTFHQNSWPFVGAQQVHRLLSGGVQLLNHSCNPNAEAIWHPDIARLVVRAMKPIAKGDEILISYIHPFMTKADRLRHLGFDCKCDECSKTGEQRKLSEMRHMTLMNGLEIIKMFMSVHVEPNRYNDIAVFTLDGIKEMLEDPSFDAVRRTAEGMIAAAKATGLRHIALAAVHEALYFICHALMTAGPIQQRISMAELAFESKFCETELLFESHGLGNGRAKAALSVLRRATGKLNTRVSRAKALIEQHGGQW